MGEMLNIVLFVLGVSVVLGLGSLASQSITDEVGYTGVPVFLSDYLFGADTSNPLTSQINQSGASWQYYSYGAADLPTQKTTGSSGYQFPDWLQSTRNFLTETSSTVFSATKIFINMIGFPYTIMVMLDMDAKVAALVGGAFSIIVFIIFVFFVLGRNA